VISGGLIGVSSRHDSSSSIETFLAWLLPLPLKEFNHAIYPLASINAASSF
jgi:hypothetical protein